MVPPLTLLYIRGFHSVNLFNFVSNRRYQCTLYTHFYIERITSIANIIIILLFACKERESLEKSKWQAFTDQIGWHQKIIFSSTINK